LGTPRAYPIWINVMVTPDIANDRSGVTVVSRIDITEALTNIHFDAFFK
jgi:hypothetical protein